MSHEAPGCDAAQGVRILGKDDLADGESRKFDLRCGGTELECFVVRWRGALHAFVNQCRHVALTLDWVENQFFTEDGELLLCPTHGALYAPDTGECVSGPPCGKWLFAVPLVERDGHVLAFCPDPLP